ncbi:MAG: cation:proton antiporter, partial [Thermanaerothrix sp.]|nr:cation:proton antiporter [Thermanaerothrix sp.]
HPNLASPRKTRPTPPDRHPNQIMPRTLLNVALLLLVAAVVAMPARRLHLPYTVGLALALLPSFSKTPLTRHLIFTLFLPPLVFEAALHLR